ncbi:CAP22 protein [Ilyonectria robusta]
MYANKIALAIAPLLLLARADLQLDNDDVPTACRAICRPIVTLTNACEVDLSGSDDTDRNENRLEAQCICTNDSFDVGHIAALCADCMRQNFRTLHRRLLDEKSRARKGCVVSDAGIN